MIAVRKAIDADIPIIQHLATSIWPRAYEDILSPEQLDYMLKTMYSKEELQRQLLDDHIFLIVGRNDQDLGFAGFSLIDQDARKYKLHKLYVLPSAQGQGIGKILIDEVICQAKEAGGVALELNVNRNNKALDFYKKVGFTIQRSVDLDIGNGFFMNDYVMEKPLV